MKWQAEQCVWPKAPLRCTGGQVDIGGQCGCPAGKAWNGRTCEVPVSCTGGRVKQGNQCVCPPRTKWNGQSCVEDIKCGGGQIVVNGRCECPQGRVWNGRACVPQSTGSGRTPGAKCPPTFQRQGDKCVCPPGQKVVDGQCKRR
jgi:hypothetical protein